MKDDGSGWKSGYRYKTVYESASYSDFQMLIYGIEAMEEAILAGRIVQQQNGDNNFVHGIASNGMKYQGYINKQTGIITSFHPVISF